jgi:uncharacterized protein DUF6624
MSRADLRADLVARGERDQAAMAAFLRTADSHREAYESTGRPTSTTPWPYTLLEWTPPEQAPAEVRRVLEVVSSNTQRLRAIVERYGWPGRSLVGEDGADAAWLLLQHAGSGVPTIGTPENHAFRRSCVPLLEQAVRAGEAHPRHLAWTVDGIQSVAGEPPVFAVLASDYAIVGGEPVFRCPVDPAAIDLRRAEIGLPPLRRDLQRRARDEQLAAAGDGRAEPWPPRVG